MNKIKCELFNDHFQNYKRYSIPKAQLVIADIPYNDEYYRSCIDFTEKGAERTLPKKKCNPSNQSVSFWKIWKESLN